MTEERAKSEFNAALEYLERLILLKQAAAQASMGLDAYGWLQSLAAIVRWVSHHMKEAEKVKAKSTILEIQSLVQQAGNKSKGLPAFGMPSNVYFLLHDFEIWLNDIIKEAGLYARMQEDAGHALN